jgi:hypothetical protein
MAKTALVFRDTERNVITSIDEDLTPIDDDHFVINVPEGIDDWRLSVNEDEELVIAYEGQDTEEALASLLADQQAEVEAVEARLEAERAAEE